MSDNEILNMYFGIIDDPRCEVNVIHPLVDILKLVMIAVLCGMDELNKIIDYGDNKKEFLEKEFDIKLIPSKATLTRVIAIINPRWLLLSIVCILKVLIKNKGDYVLQLKANQGRFYEDVYAMFDDKYMNEVDTECEYEIFSTIEKSQM